MLTRSMAMPMLKIDCSKSGGAIDDIDETMVLCYVLTLLQRALVLAAVIGLLCRVF